MKNALILIRSALQQQDIDSIPYPSQKQRSTYNEFLKHGHEIKRTFCHGIELIDLIDGLV